MSAPDLPHLEPVRDDGVRAVQVGLGLWLVAGLVLIAARDELAAHGTQWWLGVCAAGLLAGLVQLAIFSRRRALIRAREAVDASEALGSPAEYGRTGPDSTGPDTAGPASSAPTG